MNTENQLATPPSKAIVLAGERGLQFSSMDEMGRFCVAACNAGIKGIPSPEVALICLQAGLELGLSPVWSLTNIMVLNGRPSVWGDALLGIILAHTECQDVIETMAGEGDAQTATCEVKRTGRVPVIRTFSMADAKKAGLLSKDGPWKTYPTRMLAMRARSWACRDAFADALRGLGVVEEQRDVPRKIEARVVSQEMVLPEVAEVAE